MHLLLFHLSYYKIFNTLLSKIGISILKVSHIKNITITHHQVNVRAYCVLDIKSLANKSDLDLSPKRKLNCSLILILTTD